MKVGCVAVLLLMVTLGNSQTAPADGPGGFQRLSSLAGSWEGQYAWSGGSKATGKMSARYYLTGNSSALVEDLIMDGTPNMTTVYHLDNSDLRLTHFCAGKNQPRLKANKIDLQKGVIDFSLVDVTNVPSLEVPFVHEIEVQFLSPDKIALTFAVEGNGKKSYERVDLKRVTAQASK